MSLIRLGFAPVLGFLPLLAFGCSDPVPPSPRGAVVLRWADNPPTECPILSHEGRIGNVTTSAYDKVLVDGEKDGENEAVIECTVSGAGSYRVSGDAKLGLTSFGMSIQSISPEATAANPALGTVVYTSQQAQAGSVSDTTEPCAFFFPDQRPSDQRVSEGKIWVSFACSRMNYQSGYCQIEQGNAIFENCETD